MFSRPIVSILCGGKCTLSLAPSCSNKVIVGWIGGRARLDGKCVCYAYELRSSHTYLQPLGIYECL